MRVRVNFERPEEINYIGHIDLTRAVTRALRRSMLPLKFTEGFNQRVKVEMGFPLSVGIVGEDEYFDFYLTEDLPEDLILNKLREAFRGVLLIKQVKGISYGAPALTSMNAILTHFLYGKLLSEAKEEQVEDALQRIMQMEEIFVKREKKGVAKSKDIRPFIKELKLLKIEENDAIILASLYFTPKGSVKISEIEYIMKDFGIDIDIFYIVRKRTTVFYKGKLLSPMDFD